MGNAERKARKRAGEQFAHPVKEGTPLYHRKPRSMRQYKKLMDQIEILKEHDDSQVHEEAS